MGYHNHDFEFRFVENRVPFALMLDCLTDVDPAWVGPPRGRGAAYVRARRAHQDDPHQGVQTRRRGGAGGRGLRALGAVFEACETVGGTEWYIVEHEDYGSLTPMQCIEAACATSGPCGQGGRYLCPMF